LLRYKEKEDIEGRFAEVDEAVVRWREKRAGAHPAVLDEFKKKLLISLIYHDAALEGDVLSYSEIKAATDTNIISDGSLIPSYEAIQGFHSACQHAFDMVAKAKPMRIDTVRDLQQILDPTSLPGVYRKENPLHRLYYHEICSPEKIPLRMRKYGEWLESPECNELHPIVRAAESHFQLMAIFPWANHSGRLARIIANIHLELADYPVAIIHSIDRQRYYEALRSGDNQPLLGVYLEAVETTATSALRVFEEADAVRQTRAS
jgi:Fic family protein